VDPEEFFGLENDWLTPCDVDDFAPGESDPKPPLYYDVNLNNAGRYHSRDMRSNGQLSHQSSDGTSFGERVARFYSESGYVGENIAVGYPSGQSVLLDAWMCSAGHRANIMNGDYNELGVGVDENYYTQNFANGIIDTSSPIAMGNHSPKTPIDFMDFLVDFQGGWPDGVSVMVDGEPFPMDLTFGRPDQGIYTTTVMVPPEGACAEYYFIWEMDGETGTFPATESYLAGALCPEGLSSLPRQLGPKTSADETEDEVVGCLCASQAQPTGTHWGLMGLLTGLLWRRRHS
jgi:MYXO-CTERM domain-containing protein